MPKKNRLDFEPVTDRNLTQCCLHFSAPATYSFLIEKILRTVPLAHAFVSKLIVNDLMKLSCCENWVAKTESPFFRHIWMIS